MAPHTYQDPIGFYEWFDDLPYAIQDSILKHLPHMEGEEWLIVIILAALLLMILVSAYLGFARHNVKKTSERLNALKELNNTTEFMPVEAQYRYYQEGYAAGTQFRRYNSGHHCGCHERCSRYLYREVHGRVLFGVHQQ